MTSAPSAPADHVSFAALLDDDQGVHPLPHALYLALVRGDGEAPDFAGRTMTLADWGAVPRNQPAGGGVRGHQGRTLSRC